MTYYFDEIKVETDNLIKFGDSHTDEFDIWMRKNQIHYQKYYHGYVVWAPTYELKMCLT